jgi:hypothetical protein
MLIAITPWTRTRLGLILDLVLGGCMVVAGTYAAYRSRTAPRVGQVRAEPVLEERSI